MCKLLETSQWLAPTQHRLTIIQAYPVTHVVAWRSYMYNKYVIICHKKKPNGNITVTLVWYYSNVVKFNAYECYVKGLVSIYGISCTEGMIKCIQYNLL